MYKQMPNQIIDDKIKAKILKEVNRRAWKKLKVSTAKKENQEAQEALLELDNL